MLSDLIHVARLANIQGNKHKRYMRSPVKRMISGSNPELPAKFRKVRQIGMAAVLKTADLNGLSEFESLTFRQINGRFA